VLPDDIDLDPDKKKNAIDYLWHVAAMVRFQVFELGENGSDETGPVRLHWDSGINSPAENPDFIGTAAELTAHAMQWKGGSPVNPLDFTMFANAELMYQTDSEQAGRERVLAFNRAIEEHFESVELIDGKLRAKSDGFSHWLYKTALKASQEAQSSPSALLKAGPNATADVKSLMRMVSLFVQGMCVENGIHRGAGDMPVHNTQDRIRTLETNGIIDTEVAQTLIDVYSTLASVRNNAHRAAGTANDMVLVSDYPELERLLPSLVLFEESLEGAINDPWERPVDSLIEPLNDVALPPLPLPAVGGR
jgi:hypothetical protein